jgi:hypothetical protein
MGRYLIAPAYVLGLTAVTIGPYLWQPYTGKGPPGTYRTATEPAPPIAEIGEKIQTRLVQVERIPRLPWTCAEIRDYAAKHSRAQVEAKAKGLTKEQRAAAEACMKEKRT